MFFRILTGDYDASGNKGSTGDSILVSYQERRVEMSEGLPIIFVVIALVLVAVAFIALRNWEKLKQRIVSNKKSFFPLFIIGYVEYNT